MDNQFLRKLAEQVRSHSRSSTKSIIGIGEALRDAKKRLEHGKFREWVEAECRFTIRTAQNYMRAAELTDKSEIISRLNPGAIYRLAKPSRPPQVVARVLEELEKGAVPSEPEIISFIVAADQTDQEPSQALSADDNKNTHRLAREQHTRPGCDLVSQLIECRWSDLRKLLRNAPEQSECAQVGGALKVESVEQKGH